MRYLTVIEHGTHLGLKQACLILKNGKKTLLETPLSRLRIISIARHGVLISSTLLTACALRGIRIFVLDWRSRVVSMLSGVHQHATVALREKQFQFKKSPAASNLAAAFISGKIRNQRAVLLYFRKYKSRQGDHLSEELHLAGERQLAYYNRIKQTNWQRHSNWREQIMGIEGASAATYWQSLKKANLLTSTFTERLGRNAPELTNQMLNYGYTILNSQVWTSIDNAGLEPFCGILHQPRPGKPSLVLDLMEIYRPWVVDRNVIKLRRKAEKEKSFTARLKKDLADQIHSTIEKKYPYRGKRLRLDTIIQRQTYRMAGCMAEEKRFRPYHFRW